MTKRRPGLGDHAPAVFERFFDGRTRSLDPDDHAEANEFWRKLGELERPPLSSEIATDAPRRPWWRKPGHAIAASLGLALCLAVGIASIDGERAMQDLPVLAKVAELFPEQAAPDKTYRAGRGQRSIVALSDGSEVTLAPESEIRVSYTEDRRRVRLLSGEALFRVAHNKARPFIVQAAGGEVMAVGTAFDVKLHPKNQAAVVTVVDGVIRISMAVPRADTGSEISRMARKGERVEFGTSPGGRDSQSFIGASKDANVDLSVVWTHGMLFFDGERLEDAVRIANRYSEQTIVLRDRSLRNIPVYGLIRQGDTAALSDIIEHPDALRVVPPADVPLSECCKEE